MYTSDLAESLAEDLLDRFLRYVRGNTQSQRDRTQSPRKPGQLDLGGLLVERLLELGLPAADLDDNGYVMAPLPATLEDEPPTIGLIAHVDPVPDTPGDGV